MDELKVLPFTLQEQSLSEKEIILPYALALQALECLKSNQWALLGWEGLLYQAGKVGHVSDYQGTVSLERGNEEPWSEYVDRTVDICRRTIQAGQQRFDRDLGKQESELYFCLVATREGA